MRAGKNRFTIEIFSRTVNSDASVSYSSVCKTVANIQSLTGREQLIAAENQASTSHKVTMRYHPGIDPSMFVAIQGDFSGDFDFGGRIFAIDSVIDPDFRKRELVLMCSEVVSGGNY